MKNGKDVEVYIVHIISTARCSSSRPKLRGIHPLTHSTQTFWGRCYLQLWWFYFKNMQKQKILFPENVERDNWNLRKTSVACVAACVTSNDWHCGKTLVECSALSFCVLFEFRITVDLSLEIIGHRVLTAVQGSRPHIPEFGVFETNEPSSRCIWDHIGVFIWKQRPSWWPQPGPETSPEPISEKTRPEESTGKGGQILVRSKCRILVEYLSDQSED